MGKMLENPRYEVLSFRVSDEERDAIKAVVPKGGNLAQFLRDAALDKVKWMLSDKYGDDLTGAYLSGYYKDQEDGARAR